MTYFGINSFSGLLTHCEVSTTHKTPELGTLETLVCETLYCSLYALGIAALSEVLAHDVA